MTDAYDVAGKVAVVTGASSGIGEATAVRLARAGMTVVATARREGRLAALAQAHEGIEALPVDVSSTDSVDALAREVRARHGACHVLVNNAGIGGGPFRDRRDLDDAIRTLEVNLIGVFRTMGAFAELLEESAPSRVINVGSVAGKIGVGPAAYAASKFGVVGLSEALGLSWASRGITVCQLNPGYIETEGFPQEQVKRTPLKRVLGKPEDVAEAILVAVQRGEVERTVPRFYGAVVSLRHLAPPVYRRLIARNPRSSGSRD